MYRFAIVGFLVAAWLVLVFGGLKSTRIQTAIGKLERVLADR